MPISGLALTEEVVVVALEWRGIVTQDEDGEWNFEGVGPVAQFDPPDPFQVGPVNQISIVVWPYLSSLVIFGLAVAGVRSMSIWHRGLVLLLTLVAVISTVVVMNAADVNPPFGFWDPEATTGRLANTLVLVVVPLLFPIGIAVVDWRYNAHESSLAAPSLSLLGSEQGLWC